MDHIFLGFRRLRNFNSRLYPRNWECYVLETGLYYIFSKCVNIFVLVSHLPCMTLTYDLHILKDNWSSFCLLVNCSSFFFF
jgi:hypothetical protein